MTISTEANVQHEPPPETVDFIFQYIKDAPERQLAGSEALDAKMVQIFTAASVIIGLAGLTSGSQKPVSAVLLVFAVIAYVGGAGCALVQLWARDYRRSLQADELWRKLWASPVSDVKHSLVHDIAASYVHNAKLNRHKKWTVRLALIAVAVEVVFVGSAIVARLASP
jgi:hypothetical protein